jgi:photosystem II stability/assembly factor-like uncharacterized protein
MKKVILLIQVVFFFLTLTEAYSQPGWFWQNPLPQGHTLNSVKFINTTTGWAVGDGGTILRTTNSGLNWTSQTSGTTHYLNSVSFTDANTGTAVGGIYRVSTILRTTNGGINWTSQSSGTTNHLWCVNFTDANIGTAVGDLGTILRTTNGGTNWTSQSSGTTIELNCVSFSDADNGTAVGNNGIILRTTNGGVKVINISTKIPSKYLLEQNYPNPFNPTTNIKFDIPKSSLVKISIYNALGKEVATLVNEKLNSGSYNVDWNALGYPSGVYFYKLITKEFVDTKKMVLLK